MTLAHSFLSLFGAQTAVSLPSAAHADNQDMNISQTAEERALEAWAVARDAAWAFMRACDEAGTLAGYPATTEQGGFAVRYVKGHRKMVRLFHAGVPPVDVAAVSYYGSHERDE